MLKPKKPKLFGASIAGLYSTGGGGGGPSFITVTDGQSFNVGFATSQSITQQVGSATSSDLIFIAIGDDNASSGTGRTVTIGGVTATKTIGSTDNKTSIYQATGCTISSNTTAVSITTTTAMGVLNIVGGFVHGNTSNTAANTGKEEFTYSNSPLAVTVGSGEEGFIYGWKELSGTLPASWTNASRISISESQNTGANTIEGSAATFTASATVSCIFSTQGADALIYATWK